MPQGSDVFPDMSQSYVSHEETGSTDDRKAKSLEMQRVVEELYDPSNYKVLQRFRN